MGIKYGEIEFANFELFSEWTPPEKKQGLYMLAYLSRSDDSTNYFTRLYFGQTGDFDDRGWDSHKGVKCSMDELPEGKKLYIAIYETPNWTEKQRKEAETSLIKSHPTNCNKKLSA